MIVAVSLHKTHMCVVKSLVKIAALSWHSLRRFIKPAPGGIAFTDMAPVNVVPRLITAFIMTCVRGVNLYVFHVSLTDFHCFNWLTYVRGNPYRLKKKKNNNNFFFLYNFFFLNYYFFVTLAISMS